MAFPIAATAVSLVGLPIAAAQTAVVLKDAMKASSPNSRLQKWSYRMAEVSAMVDTNAHFIPAEAMIKFLDLITRYMEVKILYEQILARGHKDWYGIGKASKNNFRAAAREAWKEGLDLSTVASSTRRYCDLLHTNPGMNSRGQCIICVPEEISNVPPHNEDNGRPQLTWPNFLRSQDAQEIIERNPPTYSESQGSDDGDGHSIIDPLQLLPRVEINNMWREFRAVLNNGIQAQETEPNPWASLANLNSNGSV